MSLCVYEIWSRTQWKWEQTYNCLRELELELNNDCVFWSVSSFLFCYTDSRPWYKHHAKRSFWNMGVLSNNQDTMDIKSTEWRGSIATQKIVDDSNRQKE